MFGVETLVAISLSILMNWAFSSIMGEDEEAVRRVCQKRHREETVVGGDEVWEPIYCGDVELTNGTKLDD